jgi:hypothetical protein
MLLAQVSPGQTSVLSGFLGCRSAEMMPDEEQRCELQKQGFDMNARSHGPHHLSARNAQAAGPLLLDPP